MPTVLDQQIEETVNELMSNPEWCALLADTLKRLQTGFYPKWYQDMIFQKFERYKSSIYDAYCFVNIHTWFYTGQIVVAEIVIGCEPSADKDIVEMREKLARLKEPFRVTFEGGSADSDGKLFISRPIKFSVVDIETNLKVSDKVCGEFPIEIGTNSAVKTMSILNSVGRLARWPYGSKSIWAMYRNPKYIDDASIISLKGRQK